MPLPESVAPSLPSGLEPSPSTGTGVSSARRVPMTSSRTKKYCKVGPSVWSGSGASGSSTALYGQAGKALVGYPYRATGQTLGMYSGAESKASRPGVQGTQQYQAWGRFEWKTTLTGFPYGSYLYYFWNPIFRSQGATASRLQVGSFPVDFSTASVRYAISSSIGLSSEPNWRQEFGATDSNDDGVTRTEKVHYFNGRADGPALYRKMGILGDGGYSFAVKSFAWATANSLNGAGASALIDFGSRVEDAPFEISPYTNGLKVNGVTYTGDALSYVTMMFDLPDGWTANCP